MTEGGGGEGHGRDWYSARPLLKVWGGGDKELEFIHFGKVRKGQYMSFFVNFLGGQQFGGLLAHFVFTRDVWI
jgi:hypothetical protein